MRSWIVLTMVFWLGAGAYFFLGPGKEQVSDLRQQAMLEVGGWKPEKPTKSSNCQVRLQGQLPDPACTPGSVSVSNRSTLCLPKEFADQQRPLSRGDWGRALSDYQVQKAVRLSPDMLIPLSLGGSVTRANIWPIKNRFITQKRKVERRLLKQVCSGRLSLPRAQRQISRNWTETR